jgi:hypothetical protein
MKITLKDIGWDTAVVLFLLALEFGRAGRFFSAEGLVMGIAIAMLVVLPYLLLAVAELTFAKWLVARIAVAVGGFGLGVALPEATRFMPMTLLIVAAMISCYVQFYGLMRLRPAK